MSIEGIDAEREHTVDWESIRQRLAMINAALAGVGEPEAAMIEQIWAQRAVQLAKPPEFEEEGERLKLVLISMGRELYGLDAQYILEIRPLEQITRVPRVPDWVAGVVNLRGRIFSVVDLRRFFGLPQAAVEEGNAAEPAESIDHLVLVETPDMGVALLVDDVLAVTALPASQIQSAGDTLGDIRPEYVRGVSTQEDSEAPTVVVLNLPALLADKRLIIQEEST